MFIKVAIIGDGTKGNPYRAQLPAEVMQHSAIIPCDLQTGKPLFAECLVWIPDATTLNDKTVQVTTIDVRQALAVQPGSAVDLETFS